MTDDAVAVGTGLLVLRLALAALVAGHATQKLFGWFRGRGIAGQAPLFEASGLRPGRLMVVIAGASELTGATLLALGLATPLGAAMVIGTMLVAGFTLRANGVWAHLGGYEVPLAYGVMALVLATTGPGVFALDALMPWADVARGPGVGLLTAAVAVVAASPLLAIIASASRRTRTAG
jgi:putative oxidoreductase